MNDFKRENRYTVLKISDVGQALDADECTILIELEEKVALYRERVGKTPLECVVIESKWPEYETVWGIVEDRITNKKNHKTHLIRPIYQSKYIRVKCMGEDCPYCKHIVVKITPKEVIDNLIKHCKKLLGV